MLSSQTVRTVKESEPLIRANAVTLAHDFYERLFVTYPHLLELFDRSSVKNGTQAEALAGAICAYAANIDTLMTIHAAIDGVVAKHVAAHVRPEHYTLVGEQLLLSLEHVLGENALPHLMDAWKEAYLYLADILIEKESHFY